MKRTLIHNATIVNEGQSTQGSVVIENGRIAEVLTNWKPLSAPCEEVIDATGCYLLPGIIDDHVHFRDPGLTHKADILTESSAAAAGGVTSIMDMPNTNPLTVTLDALNSKFDLLNEKCIVNHSCYFGATNDNYTEFDKLDKSRVCGIKLFMGSSTGNMLVDKMNSLLKIFNGTDMLIAAHCEDQEIIKANIEIYKKKYKGTDDIPVNAHPGIRSVSACYASSELAIRLARIAEARLHILHVSTSKELKLFSSEPLEDKNITSEACVAHLLYTLSHYNSLGARIKCNPAIKRKTDREALRAAVNSGLFVGNLVSGGLSDRYTPERVARFAQGIAVVALALILFLAANRWAALTLTVVCTTMLFAVSSPQQVLILENAPGGQMLGAALIQVAFNLGNALGAYCGGLPIEYGLGYEYSALPGVGFALLGFVMLTLFVRRYGRRRPQTA